jgi:hypothetical protein
LRLKKKNTNGKTIIHLAQDLVAKKCGLIQEDEALDKMTLQSYLDLYMQPLSEESNQAILKLTEVVVDKAKKEEERPQERPEFQQKSTRMVMKPRRKASLSRIKARWARSFSQHLTVLRPKEGLYLLICVSVFQ